jgi:nitrite reductase/ring-hydroxylating ferredoxin subunit
MNRRDFIAAAATACVCALCPGALAGDADPVEVGVAGDFAAEGVYDRWAKQGFFLVRKGNRLYAPLSQCTHQQAPLVKERNGQRLLCTRHKGIFDSAGQPSAGPPRQALPRLQITSQEGRITVNPQRRFEPDQWEQPSSFVEL